MAAARRDALGGQRHRLEGDPRVGRLLAAALAGADDRARSSASCSCSCVTAPSRLRVRARELPFLAVFGICGLAFVQWFYFLSIHRLADRDRAPDRVPGAAARRALGALRLPRARPPADLATRSRSPSFGLGADRQRRRAAGALSTAGIAFALAAARHLRGLHPARRARASATATPSRCSPGASASRRSSGRSIAPWWSFPAGRVGRRASRCSATSTGTTCRCGR